MINLKHSIQKQIIITLTLLFSYLNVFCQKKIETFYDIARTKIKESYYVNNQNQKNGIYILYDNRGLKSVEINYLNGRPHGKAKEYYLPGIGYPGDEKIKIEANYINGEKSGVEYEYVYIDPTGKFDYEKGKKFIIRENYYEKDKSVRSIKYYTNGKKEYDIASKTGICRFWYENGNLKQEYSIQEEAYHGPFKIYYENGQIEVDGTRKNGAWFGELKTYYENGNLKSIENYDERDRYGEIRKGESKYFSENGDLLKTLYYQPIQEDKSQLVKITEYQNNKIKSIKNYIIPNRENYSKMYLYGEFKEYNDGNLVLEGNYSFPQRKSDYNYIEIKDGIWTKYKNDGTIDSQKKFNKGKRVGEWILYFDQDWREIDDINYAMYYRVINYNNDGTINTDKNVIDYYITGEKQFEGKIISENPDVFDGEIIIYYKNGNPKQIINYEKGKIKGKNLEFFENGNLMYDYTNPSFVKKFHPDGYLDSILTKGYNGYNSQSAIEYFLIQIKDNRNKINWLYTVERLDQTDPYGPYVNPSLWNDKGPEQYYKSTKKSNKSFYNLILKIEEKNLSELGSLDNKNKINTLSNILFIQKFCLDMYNKETKEIEKKLKDQTNLEDIVSIVKEFIK